MKNLRALLLLLLAGGGLLLASCDDDPAGHEAEPDPEPLVLAQPAPAASEVAERSFSVAWPAVDGARSYSYTLLSRSGHGAVAVVIPETETAALSVVCEKLRPGTEYLFRIMASGDGAATLDSAWTECSVTTLPVAGPTGPWVDFEVAYDTSSYQCKIKVSFTPNAETATYYADCIYASYFDDDPSDPTFEPNTEQDLIGYLTSQQPVSAPAKTYSWSYSSGFILGVVGVDASGNAGELHWVALETPSRSSSGGETSEAAVRMQYVIANSADLEGAPENCFATVYRFERTSGAYFFRYEDGFYEGDFAKRDAAYWRSYFGSSSNASGEDYEGFYSGWISSAELELSADGFYHYGVTFWDRQMAGETYELICTAYDSDGRPGEPACFTVTLPEKLPDPTPAGMRSALPTPAAERLLTGATIPRRR